MNRVFFAIAGGVFIAIGVFSLRGADEWANRPTSPVPRWVSRSRGWFGVIFGALVVIAAILLPDPA